MEYSVSPGGIDCWELEVRDSIGYSTNYSDFKTAGEALDYLITLYPDKIIELDVTSLSAYYKIMERENV